MAFFFWYLVIEKCYSSKETDCKILLPFDVMQMARLMKAVIKPVDLASVSQGKHRKPRKQRGNFSCDHSILGISFIQWSTSDASERSSTPLPPWSPELCKTWYNRLLAMWFTFLIVLLTPSNSFWFMPLVINGCIMSGLGCILKGWWRLLVKWFAFVF